MVRAVSQLPFLTRVWFAWVVFFKVLFDGAFAAKLFGLKSDDALVKAAPPRVEVSPVVVEKVVEKIVERALPPAPPSHDAALQLLALFQREGRLVDFLEEDVASFSDADIGAAARVVHTGCRKALREHIRLEPVRAEEEGARLTVADARPDEVKLTGNVQGSGPYSGVLRHRGWRVTNIEMPTAAGGHDPRVVAQAEVEL
jgi:hypothetical protein